MTIGGLITGAVRGTLVATAFGLSIVTASAAGLFDDNEARRQIGVERARVDEINARMGAQGQQLDAMTGRITKIEEALNRNQAVLDLFREIESLKLEIAKMRGQLEILGNGIETAQKRQQDLYVDLDTRIKRLENPLLPSTTSVGADAAGAKPGGGGAVGAAETRAYESAQNLRRIGNYQSAIVAFQGFIKQYPKSSLASSAQYWIGDSYFNLRDYKQTIASQRLLIASFPDSAKVPDALLNIASAQAEMGDSAAARRTMDEIVAKHPNSDAADKARRRISTSR
jgi:tol-pal system protein YbgF